MIEDNPADAGLVREALKEHAVQSELVLITDGERAMDFIHSVDAEQTPCPDLVILDLNLPKKPGREVLTRMRASVNFSDIPLIILTSSDSQADKDETARLGASRYIRKPYHLAEFLNLGLVFKEMLGGRSQ